MNIVDTHTKNDIRLQLCHRLYIVDPLQGEAWGLWNLPTSIASECVLVRNLAMAVRYLG